MMKCRLPAVLASFDFSHALCQACCITELTKTGRNDSEVKKKS